MKLYKSFIIAGVAACSSAAFSADCPSPVVVNTGSANSVLTKPSNILRKLDPQFFGFNLEWIEFQMSLWNKSTNSVDKNVETWLSAFPGAVYRYPGGYNANVVDWKDLTGNPSTRPSKVYVGWAAPFAPLFGVDEYLQFVKNVNGKAWYVANTYGNLQGETSITDLADSAGNLSSYLVNKKLAGQPEIFRWELGNEVDRGKIRWLPEKLASTALLVGNKIKANDSSAKFVTLMEEYSAQSSVGINRSQYNQRAATGVKDLVNEYSIHTYYDGTLGNTNSPPVPFFLNSVCNAIDDAKIVNPNNFSGVWVTEHARVPVGAFVGDWTSLYPYTNNLEAAIGVADMMIGSAQIPSVRGMFLHALYGGNGPWSLFHKNSSGSIYPSVVYWSLNILRNSMLENVIETVSTSTNISNTASKYDLRAVAMTNNERNRYSIWMINRSGTPVTVPFVLPGNSGVLMSGTQTSVSNSNIAASNKVDAGNVQPVKVPVNLLFDAQNSSTNLTLPPYSVSAFELKI